MLASISMDDSVPEARPARKELSDVVTVQRGYRVDQIFLASFRQESDSDQRNHRVHITV